jgi:hypothetical protein
MRRIFHLLGRAYELHRPAQTGEQITVRMQPDLLERLDNWRRI